MKKQKDTIIAPENQRVEKLFKKVFGGKCGYQVLSKKTEQAQMGATCTLWEIDKFSNVGRTQIYISEKHTGEDLTYMQLEIFKSNGEPGWSITDDEIKYYFFIGHKYAYQVRSPWLYSLAMTIQEYLEKDTKIKNWMDKIVKSGSKKITFIECFGVPSLPTEFEIELKCERNGAGVKVLANIDWKYCINKLKMDIERIKL